jgi:hypothetical protein
MPTAYLAPFTSNDLNVIEDRVMTSIQKETLGFQAEVKQLLQLMASAHQHQSIQSR